MPANPFCVQDKIEYETLYGMYLVDEKRAWNKWRKIIALSQEWKDLSKGFKHAFRYTHMIAYCEGANIPTLYDYLNHKETERARDNASIRA